VADEAVSLDLNSPVFQRDLFALDKRNQNAVLSTLKRIHAMTWNQLYMDAGLKWETIHSRHGPSGRRLYSFRVNQAFRVVAYREGTWLRILSLHPDHDSAYH
jgi:GH35 family endo-1,4-beta-xylanase